MKKTRILIVIAGAFLGSVSSLSYAGQGPADDFSSGSNADMNADEQVFITKLTDENAQLFTQMSQQKRREAMSKTEMMDTSGPIYSPNQAVSKVASTVDKEKTK